MVPCVLVSAKPVQPDLHNGDGAAAFDYAHNLPKQQDALDSDHEQVISVRITSSVAVGRGKSRPNKVLENKHGTPASETPHTSAVTKAATLDDINEEKVTTELPNLSGANKEFIKQLNSRKEARGLHNFEGIHAFPSDIRNKYSNESHDSVAESSMTSVLEIDSQSVENTDERIDNIPLARSVALLPPPKNYIQGLNKPLSERGNSQKLTTVSFNILHDTPKVTTNYNEPSDTYVSPTQALPSTQKFYNEPPKFYNEPAKVYSQPAKVYSEPAKFYSEPAKIYSEPAKIYSEPAKIYSEPAKIYSEPAKFYSQPASLHLSPDVNSDYTQWHHPSQRPTVTDTIMNTTPATMITNPSIVATTRHIAENQPEKNYEVDEKISVLTDGRSHGVQESSSDGCKQENCKVGYVVEGRQYRKYRVEERTSDGYIVGEYGVVRNEDGALRGVRYTADSDASPRLIYDALMKFLQLK